MVQAKDQEHNFSKNYGPQIFYYLLEQKCLR